MMGIFIEIKDLLQQAPKHLIILLILMGLDIVMGVCVSVKRKDLSSKKGLKGIAVKVAKFALVLAVEVFQNFYGNIPVANDLVIFYFLYNELESMIENAIILNIPIPEKIKELFAVTKQLNDEQVNKGLSEAKNE